MSLPRFPQFTPMTLELAPAAGELLALVRPRISEYTATNLFLFRDLHDYRVCRRDDFLFVTGRGYGGEHYAFPPLGAGDGRAAVADFAVWLADVGLPVRFFPVAAGLRDWFPADRWSAADDRDQADYVYLREELATLPGKRFHKRRNRLAKLLREEVWDYTYAPLGDEHHEQCRELAAGWCDIRCSLERPSTFQETRAADEALVYRHRLGLAGGVIVSDGRVRAFCLGEPLDEETFVVHFEKTEPGRDGLAPLINRDFCAALPAVYRYVNREQDLGDPGLRQAKTGYNPCRLDGKFRCESLTAAVS
ncbi:MAG: DUF2156 domain-containing protein [Deltaproteobacteria bacterium]|nr:DUF2156 domain-containing protein [Candidatus Anaeroferrophillacea bacterium]